MPFQIVRNDITKMQVDAVVNTANPRPVVGSGCDAGIHKKAGPQLLEARKKIGNIGVGQVAATPAFGLDAKYVFHAVGPVWQDGLHGEETLLQSCYENALRLALENNCESIAFPLMATGNYGFPKPLALRIALKVFRKFLLRHEMQIYLVVFDKTAFALSENLVASVESYIDEHYIQDKIEDEYLLPNGSFEEAEYRRLRYAKALRTEKRARSWSVLLCGEDFILKRNFAFQRVLKGDVAHQDSLFGLHRHDACGLLLLRSQNGVNDRASGQRNHKPGRNAGKRDFLAQVPAFFKLFFQKSDFGFTSGTGSPALSFKGASCSVQVYFVLSGNLLPDLAQ